MKGRRPKVQPPRAASTPPTCPEWLSDAARVEWNRVLPLLSHRVEESDAAAVAVYCATYARYVEAGKLLDKGEGNMRTVESLLRQLRGLCNDLGLTPASRGRIVEAMGDAPTPDETALDDLIRS